MSQWIKFDREDGNTWPEFGEYYIVFYIRGNGITHQSINEFEFEHDGGALGFDRIRGTVTHWQSLPEPPKD